MTPPLGRLARALDLASVLAKLAGALGMVAALARTAWLLRPGAGGRAPRLEIHHALVMGMLWALGFAALSLALRWGARAAARRRR